MSSDTIPATMTRDCDSAIVESMIRKCSQIATLPSVAVQIIQLIEQPDSTVEELNNVIVHDPVLGVKILKLVNSAYYGMPSQINSITRAMLLLGFRAVKNIVVAASLDTLFRGGRISKDFSAGDLWTHSVAVATAARMLAQIHETVPADEALVAGLIHDIGIVIEMQANRPSFIQVLQNLAADENVMFRSAEVEIFGASHEAFGAGLCKTWKFPPNLALVTGFHHRPWDVPESQRLLPALVHVADILVARIGLGYTRTVETDSVDPQLLSFMNITEANLDAIAAEIPDAMIESESMLSGAA